MSDEGMIIGRNSVTEALKAGRSITKIYMAAGNESTSLQHIKEMARDKKIVVENVPAKVLNQLVPGNRHQGVVAFAAAVNFSDLTDVLAAVSERGKVPFLVLTD